MDWLNSDHVGTPTEERNNGIATAERIFYVVRAKML
jgi:hypothetical protein